MRRSPDPRRVAPTQRAGVGLLRAVFASLAQKDRGSSSRWQDPPTMGDAWRANVATDLPHLLALMGGGGAKVIDGHDRNEMIAKAKRYIDGLLG